MTDHYFSPDPGAAHQIRTVTVEFGGRTFEFHTDAGVFSKQGFDQGSRLMLDAALPDVQGDVLDLGCGWGPVGILVKANKPDARVTLLDVNQRACDLARENALKNHASVEVVCAYGLTETVGLFDWILLNPPIRAGKQVIYRLFAQSAHHLKQGGCLAVVIRKQQGALSAKEHLMTLFSSVNLVCRHKGYHVYFCREAKQ